MHYSFIFKLLIVAVDPYLSARDRGVFLNLSISKFLQCQRSVTWVLYSRVEFTRIYVPSLRVLRFTVAVDVSAANACTAEADCVRQNDIVLRALR